jgi:hypothetical protein
MKILNPKDLVTEKIVDYCRPLSLILIIGSVKSGKVTIAKELSKQLDDRKLLISDDYIRIYGQNDALDMLERDMNENYYYDHRPIIIEGILGFRLLRRMAKNEFRLPDMVIKTECNKETISYFYEKEEPGKNLNSVFGFNKGLESIYKESVYLLESQGKKLPILTLNTSIF